MNTPRFPEVSCSQCGRSFGPGDHGFSHCSDHRAADVVQRLEDAGMDIPCEADREEAIKIVGDALREAAGQCVQ